MCSCVVYIWHVSSALRARLTQHTSVLTVHAQTFSDLDVDRLIDHTTGSLRWGAACVQIGNVWWWLWCRCSHCGCALEEDVMEDAGVDARHLISLSVGRELQALCAHETVICTLVTRKWKEERSDVYWDCAVHVAVSVGTEVLGSHFPDQRMFHVLLIFRGEM